MRCFPQARSPFLMPIKLEKISLIYYVLAALFFVGLVPLVLNGWFLSERSAVELRGVEGRYQTQLVQDKARQIEMYGQRYSELVGGIAKAFELSHDFSLLSSPVTQQKLGQILKENPYVLAFYIKPVQGEPLSVYRTEMLNEQELGGVVDSSLGQMGDEKFIIGKPQKIASSGENVISIITTVSEGENTTAAIIAVVSLREISKIMSESRGMSEKELWQSGLPILFVVDDKGNAIYHPDQKVVSIRKNMADLKIVQEWQQASSSIQSALFPFTAEYEGKQYEMIGAYSTARFGSKMSFGVIAMQDESRALASVSDMRWQTWMISLAMAFIALIIGVFLARQLSSPVSNLVSAAQKIAQGDLSTRIEPFKIKEISALGATFNVMAERLEEHIANLAKAAEDNRELFVGTVKALAAAIDGKDHYTRGHSERVSRISLAIGQRMGIDDEEYEKLRISALLHDVGKIAIDDHILKKPAALTNDEFEIMKTHPQKGYKIMSQIPAMKDFLPGMYMHHEMINGQGYPQGLKGDDIPLQAKIVSVADTFDAMTTDRPYQKGMTVEEAVDRIRSFVGTRYDGKVVEALVQACAEGQIRAGVIKLNKRSKDEKAVSEKDESDTKVA